MSEVAPVLIGGEWRRSESAATFRATNPRTREPLPTEFPVSSAAEVEEAVRTGACASRGVAALPGARRAEFLERFAERIEGRADELVGAAQEETALPASPRLADVELPRTTNQLRQAAAAARDASWTLATIDTKTNIRSRFGPLGAPVAVFGPNNFPFAFNSVAGGDFAAAIAAGNAVIAKANTGHPSTSRIFAEEALLALQETGLPEAAVQCLYRTDHSTGERFVGHPALGATGYTGSRAAGLTLKAAADAAGKPIYLELSSINPVFILPGALEERSDEIAAEFRTSCLMGTGQFCTNPGLVAVLACEATEAFLREVARGFGEAPVGTLLGGRVEDGLERAVAALQSAGAELVAGGTRGGGDGFSFSNTILRASAKTFREKPEELQAEAFGNATLVVVAESAEELEQVTESLEGNLTGCLYTDRGGKDDELYDRIARRLRFRVGRLLNDKMPTGVAVSPAMNHGGPYPATGHPGFTAVGIPASLRRFAQLECYDGVRESRLPPELRDENPEGIWRSIDGEWTTRSVG